MATINPNYENLQGSYLFANIARKVEAFKESHPEADIIRLGIGDELAEIPAVGVHDLALAGEQVVDLLGFLADAADGAAGAGGVVERAGVVVAELHNYVIAFFQCSQYFIPAAFGNKSAAAASADRAVDDV